MFSMARRSSSGLPSISASQTSSCRFDLASVGFDVYVVGDHADQIVQANGLGSKTGGIAFGARYLDQFSDQTY